MQVTSKPQECTRIVYFMTSNRFSLEFESDPITEKKNTTFIKKQKQGTAEEARHYLHLFIPRSHSLRTSRAAACLLLRQFPPHTSSTAVALLSACCTAGNSAISSFTCNSYFFFSRRDILTSSTDSGTTQWKVPDRALYPHNICTLKK